MSADSEKLLMLARELCEGTDADKLKALDVLEKARTLGSLEASYAIATWYLHGVVVEIDHNKGAALLKIAAEGGYPAAQYDLAVCYETGQGVDADDRLAIQWYASAARAGDMQSAFECGRLASKAGDTEQWKEWMHLAAKGGDAEAQYALGWAYEYGEQVEKDLVKALSYYELAAKQGIEDAIVALQDLRPGN